MFLIKVLVVVVVAALALWFIQNRRRRRALDKAAQSLGMSYEDKSDLDTSGQLSQLALFGGKEHESVSERMWKKTPNLEVNLFGYHYSHGGGDSSRVKHAVVVYRSEHLNFPKMEILPEYWCNEERVPEELRIRLETDAFNKHFYLKGNGSNEAEVRQIMTPELIEYLNDNRGVALEASGSVLTFYRSVAKITPEITQGFIRQGKEILQLMIADEVLASELLKD